MVRPLGHDEGLGGAHIIANDLPPSFHQPWYDASLTYSRRVVATRHDSHRHGPTSNSTFALDAFSGIFGQGLARSCFPRTALLLSSSRSLHLSNPASAEMVVDCLPSGGSAEIIVSATVRRLTRNLRSFSRLIGRAPPKVAAHRLQYSARGPSRLPQTSRARNRPCREIASARPCVRSSAEQQALQPRTV